MRRQHACFFSLFLALGLCSQVSAQQFSFGLNGQPAINGLQITQLAPDSAMLRLQSASVQGFTASAEVGDVITAMNGQPIRNVNDLELAKRQLALSNGECVISLICTKTGQLHDFRVTAKRVGNQNLLPTPGLRRVHFLICGQTGTDRPGFNKSIQANMNMLRNLVNSVTGQYVCCSTFLEGPECNQSSITQRLDALRAGPDDTIFFYYSGHGAHDAAGNHFFQLAANRGGGPTNSGDMYRTAVSQRLANKNARLKLLITESCNAQAEFRPFQQYTRHERGGSVQALSDFESLLLENRGFIDLNSAAPGQYGWGGASGGIFSTVFVHQLTRNRDWMELFNAVSSKASHKYRETRQLAMNSGNVNPNMQQQQDMRPHFYRRELVADPYRR